MQKTNKRKEPTILWCYTPPALPAELLVRCDFYGCGLLLDGPLALRSPFRPRCACSCKVDLAVLQVLHTHLQLHRACSDSAGS